MESTGRRVLACAGIAFVTSLALYTLTLAPTVTLVDSGELIVAARTLGVAHPPGFPLYTLLAHLATLLPVRSIAVRVGFASAFFAALAVGVLSLVAGEALLATAPVSSRRRIAARRDQDSKRSGKQSVDVAAGDAALPATAVPVLSAALLMACSRTLWEYATIAEVYTLNTLLIVLVFWLMLRWRRGMLLRRARPVAAPTDGLLYAAAFVFGLGLAVHHVTVGLTLPALATLVYATAGPAFFKSRRLPAAALCALAGLSVYAYLPIAALRAPVLNWGDPRTLQRLWWHVTGRQFQAYFSFSAAQLGTQLRDFVWLAGREFGPWWCPFGLIVAGCGFYAVFRRDRALFTFLALVVAADVAYGVSYEIAEDKAAYYLPAFVASAIAVACGAQWLMWRAVQLGTRHAARIGAAVLCLAPVVAFASNFGFCDHHRYFIAHDYADNILATVEPGGMLLTLDWQVCSPLLYVRLIEQRRRDVIVIDINLLRRSWYFDYLQREYPELMATTRVPVDAFLEDLRQWEQDPALYQRDATLNARIDTRFTAMILAFVSQHMQSAPVYVTEDVALNRDPANSRLAQGLTGAYQFVPQGLVFQAFADRTFHQPASPSLVTRGLADGSLKFDVDDVVTIKVLPVYVRMLYNRGRYLSVYGQHEAAAALYRQALALDPSFALARRALADQRPGVRPPE